MSLEISNQEQLKILEFNSNTLETSLFQVEDVVNDNACFYRAFANGLNYTSPNKSLHDIKDLKHFGTYKDLEETYQHPDWGYYSDKQDKLARYLQGKSYRWIKRNYKNQLEEYGMDMGTMILLTHEIDIDMYLDRYKYFAGDIILESYDEASNQDIEIDNVIEYEMEDRWGGMPEQVALSESYKIPIIILTSQKYDKRYKKIVNGKIRLNKPEKNVRFKILQIYGKKYIGSKTPIFLLWKKKDRIGHYMSLYPKNKEFITNILTNQINDYKISA